MGAQITFKTDGGTALGYEAVPASGKGPGLLVIQEWWGLVPHVRTLCDRFAAEGFVALAPDLYHGRIGTSPDEAGRMMMALNIEHAGRDLGGAIRHLLAHPSVLTGRVGVLGFCMGGQLALYSASRFPALGACVDFYGIHPNVKPDFRAIRCPVLGLFGEKDEFVSPESARKLEKGLKAAGVRTDFTVFAGAGHAFFNDARPEAYNKDAADKAWDKVLAFLRGSLCPEGAALKN